MTTPGGAVLDAHELRGTTERQLRGRVVTLTPAPVLDRLYVLDDLRLGEVNRAHDVRTVLSGKGVNVARNLHGAGAECIAVVPLSDADRVWLPEGRYEIVPTARPLRVNTVVATRSGITTNVNAAPTALTDREWNQLLDAVIDAATSIGADWIVVAGSLPRSSTGATLPPERLFREAHAIGARVCLDSGGAQLREWLHQGCPPDLVKPNLAELSEAAGRPIASVRDAARAAEELLSAGVGAVLASFGADGAAIMTSRQTIWGCPPPVSAVNSTGAGDAALAGFLADLRDASDEAMLTEAIERAVSWGALAVRALETVPR